MCKNILLADLLRSQYLLEMLQISLTFKNSEKVVKSGCSVKRLRWRAPIFSQNKRGIKSHLCKNIDISLNHKEVGIYLKYSTLIHCEN